MAYLDALRASIPQQLLEAIGLPATHAQGHAEALPGSTVDILLQLAAGASCPANLQAKHEKQWKEGQERFLSRVGSAAGLGKRTRVADEEVESQETKETNGASSWSTSNKKPKIDTSKDERGEPRYTLHAISVSTPVRKKVDVTITSTSLLLSIPSSDVDKASELAHPPIPLSSLKRAFLVPNLGKNRNKPHWTVVLATADVVSKKSDAATQMQVVFTVDRAPTGKDLFAVTDYTKGSSNERSTQPKGTETQPFLESFLSFLPPSISQVTVSSFDMAPPQQQIFKSSFNQPYLDTYRAAKEGSLYFLPEGILWAESRPVEFFALEDLAPDSDDPSLGGVRTLSATGRTFSLYVRRWIREEKDKEKKDGDDEEDEGILVDEVEFSMIDGREQENVMQWVRRYKRKFGQREEEEGVSAEEVKATKKNGAVDKGKGKATIEDLDDDTDEEDEDFVVSSSDESSSSDSEDTEGGDGGGGAGSDGEAEAADSDSDEEGEGGEGDGDVEMGDEEMSAERHPLLRPGAMPRMSKAAMDMAVAMVTQDFAGGGEGPEDEDDEGDELDD